MTWPQCGRGVCAGSGWFGDRDNTSERHRHCSCGNPCQVCTPASVPEWAMGPQPAPGAAPRLTDAQLGAIGGRIRLGDASSAGADRLSLYVELERTRAELRLRPSAQVVADAHRQVDELRAALRLIGVTVRTHLD